MSTCSSHHAKFARVNNDLHFDAIQAVQVLFERMSWVFKLVSIGIFQGG